MRIRKRSRILIFWPAWSMRPSAIFLGVAVNIAAGSFKKYL